jgi:hypothetical protein
MVKKESILKTTVCYWSSDDNCFVAESPLFNRAAGIGQTPGEAVDHFRRMIDIAYEDLKANKIAGLDKKGRPAKQGKQLSCKVQPDTCRAIKELADRFEISQGEMVDLVTFFYTMRSGESPEIPRQDEIVQRLTAIEKQMRFVKTAVNEASGIYSSSTGTTRRTRSGSRATRGKGGLK